MSLQARITRDDVSPALGKLDAALHSLGPILEAVGLEVVSITQRAFSDSSLRVTPWAPKRDGSPATLIQSGVLRQSIRITSVSGSTVAVGSDRIYAAIQQLGGTIVPKPGNKTLVFKSGGVTFFAKKVTIPPRPFFPIDKAGNLSSLAQRKIAGVLDTALKVYLPGS
jgi:phage gpG-like protein